jgi:hypothetical protein
MVLVVWAYAQLSIRPSTSHTVIASEAKQSKKDGLLRRFAPRNDADSPEHTFIFPRRVAPEFCISLRPRKGVALPQEGSKRDPQKGAGNAGCPMHPQPRV